MSRLQNSLQPRLHGRHSLPQQMTVNPFPAFSPGQCKANTPNGVAGSSPSPRSGPARRAASRRLRLASLKWPFRHALALGTAGCRAPPFLARPTEKRPSSGPTAGANRKGVNHERGRKARARLSEGASQGLPFPCAISVCRSLEVSLQTRGGEEAARGGRTTPFGRSYSSCPPASRVSVLHFSGSS